MKKGLCGDRPLFANQRRQRSQSHVTELQRSWWPSASANTAPLSSVAMIVGVWYMRLLTIREIVAPHRALRPFRSGAAQFHLTARKLENRGRFAPKLAGRRAAASHMSSSAMCARGQPLAKDL